MKRQLPALSVIIIIFLLVINISCKKTAGTAPNANIPLAKYIMGDTSLKLFTEVLQRSNNIGLLALTDSLTILAPDNNAFIAAGLPDTVIRNLSAAALDQIARYHFLNGQVTPTAPSYNPYMSQLDSMVFGYAGSGTLYFNGVAASGKTAITGSNAILYKMQAPMLVPVDSLAGLAIADSNFTYFTEAVMRTGINIYPSTGWNTLLVPDNNAFIAAGYPTLGSIDSTDSVSLYNILQYHIVPSQYFSNNLLGLNSLLSINGETIALSSAGTVFQFTGKGNTSAATATKLNRIMASSIVLHKINQVLLP